jgi:hypothetical protein
MEYIYPNDLVNELKNKWKHLQKIFNSSNPGSKAKKLESPFPDDTNLKLLLDTIYHTSFLTEESRKVAVRISYIQPSLCKRGKITNLSYDPYKFVNPKPFNSSELLRLAPSIDPNQSMLLVCESDKVLPKIKESPLVIWGILHIGTEWWKAITSRSSGASCPPNLLTLSSFSPGNINATTLGMVMFRLESGKSLGIALEDIGDGIIGSFFEENAKKLYDATVKKLQLKKYDQKQKDFDKHPYHSYFRTISNIINIAKERRHGTTFLFFPDEVNYNDPRLTDRVNIKYVLNEQKVWPLLIKECVANYHYYKLLFVSKFKFLTDDEKADPKKLKDLIKWELLHRGSEEDILEFGEFVAGLTGVDGAVIMNKNLKILGYGGEITAQSMSLKTVKLASDPFAKNTKSVTIDSFGTRHRSAFRICSSFENCVAFVISQDGGIKTIKRVGPHVIMWDNVNVGQNGI